MAKLIFRRSLIISRADLISVWKKVHALKLLFIYRRDEVVCYVLSLLFLHFFIGSKYEFHVNAERTIVKTQKCKEISASMVKTYVWHDTSSIGNN